MTLVACSSTSEKKEQAELHLNIGTAHLTKGHYPQALRELLLAEELDPSNPTVQNNLGLAYFVRNELAKAEEHLKRALELNNDYSDARNNLGRVYIEQGLYDSAIRELNIVTKDLVYPSPEKAYVNLGLAYLKKNDPRTAKNVLQKAIEANNKFCTSHNYYGQALLELREYSSAASSFETALSLCKNDYDEAHYYSGVSYYKLGNKEKAEARLNEVIKLYPNSDYRKKAVSMLKLINKD